jgi:hypothetical protein
MERFSMIPKWDAVVVAAAVVVGSMIIEHSHRVDTGAADDAITSSSDACDASSAYQQSGLRPASQFNLEEGSSSADADDTTAASSGCADQ